jgi:hypothetical protein
MIHHIVLAFPKKLQREAYRSGTTAINKLRKYAPFRAKILRLMGEYYWLIGNQTKALKWWEESIMKGEKLGARLDLSRTYFEIGKHLLGPESRYRELNGIDAKGYLDNAAVLFEEMELTHDLEDLATLKEAHGLL